MWKAAIVKVRSTGLFCKMIKISIITATLNSASTLRDTFDSILRQNYTNYELIVKDGGSTDATLAICQEYETRFKGRMRVISDKDTGIYDAMNKGISAASGDIVGLLNSDDFYTADDILHTVVENFNQHPDIDALYADIHYVKDSNITRTTRYYSSRLFRRSWMRMGFMPAHPSFYCRKTTYEKFKLGELSQCDALGNPYKIFFNPSYKVAGDFENLLRMIFNGRIKTHYISRDFVTMRTSGASSSGLISHKNIHREQLRAFKENGVYSNHFLIMLRYVYKIAEKSWSKIRL